MSVLIQQRYRIKEVIHQGLLNSVYLGQDEKEGTEVAIKKLSLTNTQNFSEAILRYKQEAEIIKRLEHTNILKLYDLVEEKQEVFLIMEYFPGKNLKQAAGDYTYKEKLIIAKKLSETLSYIHAQHIIHRDLKAHNILISGGKNPEVKIIDFGLAFFIDVEKQLQINCSVGSFTYIAPEQTGLFQRGVDHRSDLYSFGVTLYEFFTGQLPFEGKDIGEIIHKHLAAQPKPPQELNAEISASLGRVILKLMRKEPEERYQNARLLARDLEKVWLFPEDQTFALAQEEERAQINYQTKMVGRNKELAFLALSKNLSGSDGAQYLVLRGESGAGKSKLIQVFKESAARENTNFFEYKCTETEQNLPFAPFIGLINYFIAQKLFKTEDETDLNLEERDILSQAFPSLKEIFGETKQPWASLPQQHKSLLFEGVKKIFERVSQENIEPLMVFFDDIHWLDKESLQLLLFLSAHFRRRGFWWLGAIREEDQQNLMYQSLAKNSRNFKILELSPLSEEEMLLFMQRMLGQILEWPAHILRDCYQKTLGKPLNIQELLKQLSDQSIIIHEDNQWKLLEERWSSFFYSLDASQMLLSRLNFFEPGERQLLALAAIIGTDFNLVLLQQLFVEQAKEDQSGLSALWGIEKIVKMIDKGKEQHLIKVNLSQGRGFYSFVHDRIKDALLKEFSTRERSKLHLICARTIETVYHNQLEDKVYPLAYHYNQTDQTQKKIFYNTKAYERALSLFSLSESVYYMKKLAHIYLERKSISHSQSRLFVTLTRNMHIIGEIQESFLFLKGGLEKIQGRGWFEEELLLNYQLGNTYYFLNDLDYAQQCYENALSLSGKLEGTVYIPYIYQALGTVEFFRYHLDEAILLFNRVIEAMEGERIQELLPNYGYRMWSYLNQGEFERALEDCEYLESSLSWAENPLILAQLYQQISVYYSFTGQDPKKAIRYTELSQELSRKADNQLYLYGSFFGRLPALLAERRYNEGLQEAKDIAQMLEKSQIRIGHELIYAYLAECYLGSGYFEKANEIALNFLERENCHLGAFLILLKVRALYLYADSKWEQCRRVVGQGRLLSGAKGIDFLGMFFREMSAWLYEKSGDKAEAQRERESTRELLGRKKGLVSLLRQSEQEIWLSEKELRQRQLSENYVVSASMIKENLRTENIIKTSQLISSILDIDELLSMIVQKTLEVTGAERGALFLKEKNQKELRQKVAIGSSGEKMLEVSKTMFSSVLENEQMLVFPGRAVPKALEEELTRLEIRSALLCPLIFEKKLLGVFYLDSKLLKNLFSEDDAQLLQVFATQAAISIINAEQNALIKQQLYDSIQIISSLIAAASSRLYEKAQEVSRIALLLAEKLELAPAEVENIRLASLLYDLGMVGALEHHLSSGRALSEDGKHLLENHPQKSLDLLKNLHGIHGVKEIIKQHHERFDGSGYPLGLKGQEILFGARIIGLVDDFYLMLRQRKFQTTDKKAQILQQLRAQASIYDTRVLSAFLDLIEEKELIYKVKEADITVKEISRGRSFEIPSNLHLESIVVARIMEYLEGLNLDPEFLFSLDYSLGEVIRNAIVHGNRYDERKKVLISVEQSPDNERRALEIRVRDQGQGMDIGAHNQFSESRRQLFDTVDALRNYARQLPTQEERGKIEPILSSLMDFKTKYYTDFNSFRSLEAEELSGGLGLLYVKKTFDEVVFKNIYESSHIIGAEVFMRKELGKVNLP